MEILVYIGFGVAIIGSIGLLIAAFRESVLWGLGCLLISPVSVIFLFIHWDEAKNPFLLQLAGIGLILLGIFMGAEVNI
jgi:hypothetical protein